MTETTLTMMLNRREERVLFQKDLIERYHVPIISFSMNIAGPYKTDKFIECAFFTGLRRILDRLSKEKIKPLFFKAFFLTTGPEAFICVDCDPVSLKRWAVEIEDSSVLGRLFDIDIIGVDFNKIERKTLGCEERKCLLCNNEAKLCSSRRLHSVSELQEKTQEIVRTSYTRDFVPFVTSLAIDSSLAISDLTDFLFSYYCKAYGLGVYEKDSKLCFERRIQND